MQEFDRYCKLQYDMVKESREVLLEYCRKISPDQLLASSATFGRGGSIRNLLVHNANTYEFWIGHIGLEKEATFSAYEAVTSVDELIRLYGNIDNLMKEFLKQYSGTMEESLSFKINGRKNTASPFRIFSHVITHEFHHKGQILSLSRQLGYKPVDTDIMR